MRRKSERNKAKASPEKKTEKPTRKSTRRRGRRSPSTSPERENSSNDGATLSTRESDGESTHSRLQTRECGKIDEAPENKVSSTETEVTAQQQPESPQEPQQAQQQPEEEEDAGSVWKVARADASPGEIQKLKLCRQRNMSETSDASSSRKRTNKWHEGGDGAAEEVDSADEPSSALRKTAADKEEPAEVTNSAPPGRDSSEEVSDSKEIPPENASAELSDDKPNIDDDRQGETIETPMICVAFERIDDNEPVDPAPNAPEVTTIDAGSNGEPSEDQIPKEDTVTKFVIAEDIAKRDTTSVDKEKDAKPLKESSSENEDKVGKSAGQKTQGERSDTSAEKTGHGSYKKIVRERSISSEEKAGYSSNRKIMRERSDSSEVKTGHSSNKKSARDRSGSFEEKAQHRSNKKIVRERSVSSEDKSRRSSNKKNAGECSDSSVDYSGEERTKKIARQTMPRTTSRRKHRDKYRDFSNSETAESEDDSERIERVKRNKDVEENKEDAKFMEKDETKETKKASRTPEPRFDTPTENDAPMEVENNKIDNEKPKDNEKSECPDETAATAPIVQSQNNYKPAKVNLKRSFAGRISADTPETKKETTDNHANDFANQDKENHASSEQVDPKSIPKKRRWGTILASTDSTPAFTVSTDSLKVLVPGARPLSINEVRLSKDDDEEKERRSQREKRYSTGDPTSDHKSREDGENPKNADTKKDAKGDNHIASRRKISIIKDIPHAKSPSPPAAIPTSILLIKNLVRPFTLNQIRELLSRTGNIVENGFWMDRIKSKCFVEYSNEDQAFETRQALHGISWPVSNPKRLLVEYATKEDMASARELSKDQPISRKAEPLAVNDGWQQDWARDERPNAATKVTVVREWDLGKEDGQHFAKDKEREKKDHDKKRRQRSRSPILEAHLPAPARKFKKKEDDPPPAKLLDDLFRKTKAAPCIYWLPLTNEQIVVKEEMRRQHMAEHARRLEEMRRAERNRDVRRRRSPRK